MPYLTTDDNVKLYYEDGGSGIPVVFVHDLKGSPAEYKAGLDLAIVPQGL